MAENNEELEMGLFAEDGPLELNLDGLMPEVEEQELPTEETEENETPDDTSSEGGSDNELSEDETPETVAEEEGSDTEGGDTSPDLFSSFAEVLHEQGLLPSADLQQSKVESIEDLTNLIKAEMDIQAKQYLVDKVGEEGLEALEKGVTLAELQQHNQDTQTLNSITEEMITENAELAKELIFRDYVAQGLSESRAKGLLEKIIDLGEESLITDAKESLESLKTLEQKRIEQLAVEREKEQIQRQKNQEKLDNDLKNAVYNSEEYIKGMKIDKGIQDRVYSSITGVVGRSPEGVPENKLMKHRRENPIEFDVRLYYLYEITDGFTNFSKVESKQTSKATDKLTQALRKNKFDTSGTPTYAQDDDSYDGILGSELVL